MYLLNGGLFVGLGVALMRRTDLAPFSGWWMYVHAWQEKGNGEICCSREQPTGGPPFGFLGGAGYMCVIGRTCFGLPVVYLIVIGWLMLGSRVFLRLQSLHC